VLLGTIAVVALAGLAHGARADVIINASGQTQTVACDGGAAVLAGNGNRVSFHGPCGSLRVKGAGNTVDINLMPGGQVTVSGDGNHVRYTPIVPGPLVDLLGSANQVVASENVPPPPPRANPAATLVLDGDGQNRDQFCGGQNVVIHGSFGHFVLRGGCLSVRVEGRQDTIQAQLRPAAPVQIGGDSVVLNYTLTSNGPPPVVSLQGANARVSEVTHGSTSAVVVRPGSTTTTIIGAQP
jgi:hypothetical protein